MFKEGSDNYRYRHGMFGTRLYNIWRSMKQRCYCPNHLYYKYYGGKGISVCNKWLVFACYKNDMYESYLEHVEAFGEKDTTMDRIDSNGNYELSNVSWSTRKEQANNRKEGSNRRYFVATRIKESITYLLPEGYSEESNNGKAFASKYNFSLSGVYKCLKGKNKSSDGWKFEYKETVEND